MKIIQNIAPQIGPGPSGKPSVLAAGPSFAERIEAGSGAKQVLSTRALGFSETGLLGVHNAQVLSNDSPACGQLDLGSRKPGAQTMPVATLVPNVGKAGQAKSIQLGVRSPISSLMNQSQNSSRFVDVFPYDKLTDTTIEIRFDNLGPEEINASRGHLAQALRRYIPPTKRKSNTGIHIIETDNGINIIIHDAIEALDFLPEITRLAHVAAGDFGMTVKQLIVKGHFN